MDLRASGALVNEKRHEKRAFVSVEDAQETTLARIVPEAVEESDDPSKMSVEPTRHLIGDPSHTRCS